MNRSNLKDMALTHWEQWPPERVAALRADGELAASLEAAASMAERDIADLVRQGYQQHEAEEQVLPLRILLKPEPDAELADWEREESEELEREYQAWMREFQADPVPDPDERC